MVYEFGPKVFGSENFTAGRVISKEEIITDLKKLKQTDKVVSYIQQNQGIPEKK